MRTFSKLTGAIMTAVLGLTSVACGTNANDLLIQYASAAATTALDQWLTGLANGFVGTPLVDVPDDGDGDPTPGDGDASGGDGQGPTGDPTVGEELYTANSCAACHCADATGGCALAAPAIIGAGADSLASVLEPTSTHPSKPALSEQDVADMAAFLGSVVP